MINGRTCDREPSRWDRRGPCIYLNETGILSVRITAEPSHVHSALRTCLSMRSCPLRSVGNHQANRLPKADSVRLLTLVHDVAVTPERRHVIKGNHSASYTFSKQGEHRSPNIEPRSLSLPHTETLARLHMSRSRSHKIICFLAR